MDKRSLQEDEYLFPYHHLVELSPFSQSKELYWGYEYAAYLEHVLDVLSSVSYTRLLDVGCGDGKLLHELSKTHTGVLVGTDFDERALQFARAFTPQVRFEKEIPKEQFDAFTLIEVVEHIPPSEIERFFNTLTQSLAPGAVGVITVPSDTMPLIEKHYQHFNMRTLTAVLEPHFLIESMTYLNARTHVTRFLQRCFANQFFILNHKGIRNALFRFYTRHYLVASPLTGTRILAQVRCKN